MDIVLDPEEMEAISKARESYKAHLQNGGLPSNNGGVPGSKGMHRVDSGDLNYQGIPSMTDIGYDQTSLSDGSLGSVHDLGSIPTKKKKRRMEDGGHLLATMYAATLIVLGICFPVREVLRQLWLTTIVEAVYLVYLYGVSFAFILFVEIYLIQMDRKHGHQKKKDKAKPQILVKDRNRETQSIYDTVNGKFMATDNIALAKRRQSMVEAARGVEIYILEPPTDHDEPTPHHTSLYVRFGTVIFGVGNMVYDGLLLKQIQENEANCLATTFVWPYYLNLVFLLCQTYFIFKHQQIHIISVKPLARFGFLHLFATNICVWIRTVLRETLDSFLHHSQDHGADSDHGDSGGHSDGSGDHGDDHGSYGYNGTGYGMSYNATWHNTTEAPHGAICNAEKDILMKASPYLFPCVLEYSLLAAAVVFSMYDDVGMESMSEDSLEQTASVIHKAEEEIAENAFTTTINFHKSHKGMFAGVTIIAATMVSIVLFFAYMDDAGESANTAVLIYHATIIGLYCLVIFATLMALVQLHPLKFNKKQRRSVDDVMLGIAMCGFGLFQVLKLIPLISHINRLGHLTQNDALTLVECALALVLIVEQTWFMIDGMRRTSKTEEHYIKKPGRGAVMFLLLTNIGLWLFRTFHMKEVELDGDLQELEYGYLAWQLILHALVPLLIFYHFHSSACLAHIWSSAYMAPPPEPEPSKHLQGPKSDDDDDNSDDDNLPHNDLTARHVMHLKQQRPRRPRVPVRSISEIVDESHTSPTLEKGPYVECSPNGHTDMHLEVPDSNDAPIGSPPGYSDLHPDSHLPETNTYSLEQAENDWKPEHAEKVKKSSMKWKHKLRASSVKWKDLEPQDKDQVTLKNVRNKSAGTLQNLEQDGADKLLKASKSTPNFPHNIPEAKSSIVPPDVATEVAPDPEVTPEVRLNGTETLVPMQEKEVHWGDSDEDASSVTWHQPREDSPHMVLQVHEGDQEESL